MNETGVALIRRMLAQDFNKQPQLKIGPTPHNWIIRKWSV